ncbi:uncharacterized protein LOC103708224 [Phoenix dactylifera]|uniref:Uncharacterized protein LOC103708224 n=1 Tax=Phoenix dactylifera TaxID=42345 RepID=A0A8B7C473_PHODC|nr:uncharacterized protein LOC103708224 [Phoenix dactylifera]
MDRSAHPSRAPSVSGSAIQSPSSSLFREFPVSETPPPAQSGNSLLPIQPSLGSSSFSHPLSLRPFAEGLPGGSPIDPHGVPSDEALDEDVADGELDPLSGSARVRSCDVYLSFTGRRVSLFRLVKWLRAELEMQGVMCFISDRRRCKDACAHSIAREAMEAAAFGVVVITCRSLSNAYSMEEMRIFLERKKLVPIFFGLSQGDCIARDIVHRRGELWERFGGDLWTAYGGLENEWKEVVNGLSRAELKWEVNAGNYRDSIMDVLLLLGKGLGRTSVIEKVNRWREMVAKELPFCRNLHFVGRKRELMELEMLLFGDVKGKHHDDYIEISTRTRHRRKMTGGSSRRDRIAKENEETRSKGKEPSMWKENENDIEMEGIGSGERPLRLGRKCSATHLLYGKGVACVSGDSGIGKTELLLEFAYRFSQRYKMILWVGGEARYLRQNFMKLLPLLGVDVHMDNELSPERNGPRSFEDIEEEAIRKVRKELMRDIPFLLVIDNLEREKDWWDGRNVMELLPRFGGETHVLISTRLPRILNIEPLRLPCLSGSEAMSLMKGSLRDLKTEEADALRIFEEKLDRLPLGLSLVGAILSELPTTPSKLLDSINRLPFGEHTWSGEDLILRHNPFLVQLLDVCFATLDQAEKPDKLATKMVQASYWFAPSVIPIPMLVRAACETSRSHHGSQFWRSCLPVSSCNWMMSKAQTSKADASSMLVRFRLARRSTKNGYISFHDIIKLYAHKKGDGGIARSVIQAISTEGSLLQHSDHIWAACLLLFKFGRDPVAVNLSTHDLLSFIRRFVVPLAYHTFTRYSWSSAVMELLRLCTETLEALEDSFLVEVDNTRNNSSSMRRPKGQSSIHSDPLLYQDLAHLRAMLLETRAKFMLKGGQYDIGEQLCRTAVSIKEVIYGWDHPETQATRETLEQLMRNRDLWL